MAIFRFLRSAFAVATTVIVAVSAAPPSFPQSGNGMWYKSPGVIWSKDWLPIGNGYLAGESATVYCCETGWDSILCSDDAGRYCL